jgi:peptidoglycan/LPS O-acetylase OafA/YrhL
LYRRIFSNKLAVFLSTISFNLYIWHQFLCTAFKKNHIPYYEGDTPPNELGDTAWMWKLLILSFAAAFAAAIAATYLIERPASRLIMKLGSKSSGHSGSAAGIPDRNAHSNRGKSKKSASKR